MIESIVYETTREIYSIDDKLRIATIFLFCQEMDSMLFAELLYTEDHKKFIERLNDDYSSYEVDFSIRLHDKNVSNSFFKTLEKVREKLDSDGYYKALYKGDEFALVIQDIINYDFGKMKLEKFPHRVTTQLTKMATQLSIEF